MVNIQEDQRAEITHCLQAIGITQPELFSIIHGRLMQVNDKPITFNTYPDDRTKRLVDREFNLSTMNQLPEQNALTAGHWFSDYQPAASVEEGLAKTLNLKIGDRLQFDIAGQLVSAPITSLRKLKWGSMRVNFFVILNPQLMADMPQTWITAFNSPDTRPFRQSTDARFPKLDCGRYRQRHQAYPRRDRSGSGGG